MQIEIKQLNVAMELKNKGVKLRVRDPKGRHLGDMVFTRGKVVWCPGRTTLAKGKVKTWAQIINFFMDR